MQTQTEQLFQPVKLANTELKNRLAVAPMTRVSALDDGCAGGLMADYYAGYAAGGFGLIISEGLYTDKAYSQGYYLQPGLSDDQQAASWQPVLSAVHARGAKLIAQLMHAGGLSQFNAYREASAAPSAVQPLGEQMGFYYGEGRYAVPREMTVADIDEAIQGFVAAAVRAKQAGFNGVELHGANGYLLDQFLTVYTNQRHDEFGGSLTNRLELLKRLILSVREAVGAQFLLGVRFSQKKVNDTEYCWPEGEAAAQQIFRLVAECGADYIHTTEPRLDAPAFEGSASLAALARKFSGLPVIANGGVDTAEDAGFMLESEQADVISLGKAALANPDWPQRVARQQALHDFDFAMLVPIANVENGNAYLNSRAEV